MRTLFGKLRSERGASMLIALLFFLLCLTVGSLILAAATANVAKTKDRYKQQQDYLAVASAARLLKDKLGGYTYTTGQVRVPGETDPETGEKGEDTWNPVVFVTPADSMNGDLLTDAYNNLAEGNTDFTERFYITAGQGMPSVTADFDMKSDSNTDSDTAPDGNAVIVLTAGDYSMKISFTAHTVHATDNTERDEANYDYWTTSWDTGVISKGVA